MLLACSCNQSTSTCSVSLLATAPLPQVTGLNSSRLTRGNLPKFHIVSQRKRRSLQFGRQAVACAKNEPGEASVEVATTADLPNVWQHNILGVLATAFQSVQTAIKPAFTESSQLLKEPHREAEQSQFWSQEEKADTGSTVHPPLAAEPSAIGVAKHLEPSHSDFSSKATESSSAPADGNSTARHTAGSKLGHEFVAFEHRSNIRGSNRQADEVWAKAWHALEPPEITNPGRQALPSAWGRTKQKQRKPEQMQATGIEEDNARAVKQPVLALQGLSPSARAQLLALSLLALELQVKSLPADFVRQGTEAEWKLLLPALLASCSVRAAQGWLGYTPPEVQHEAGQLLLALEAGSGRYEYNIALPSRRTAPQEPKTSGGPPKREKTLQTPNPERLVPSLWNAAEERAGVHAIVIKHLFSTETHSNSSSNRSSGNSSNDTHGRSTGTSAASNMAPFPSASTEEDPQDSLLQPSTSASPIDPSIDLREQQRTPKCTTNSGDPGQQAGKKDRHLFGFLFGTQRRRSSGTQDGTDTERMTPRGFPDGDVGDAAGQVQSSATRLAALQMMENNLPGIRGWGAKQGSKDADAASPIIRSSPAVLQDMAVAVSEAVAAAYLAEAGLGLSGGPAKVRSSQIQSGAWPTFLHPSLSSTRALERFRNQIAFQQFLERNWEGVAAMYEDKHHLWGLAPGVRIVRRSVSVRRAKELQGLQGWRATISLILEALDFAAPLIQRIGRRGSEALSWLLVTLIGRSLGLVFRGIRQSLRPNRRPKSQKTSTTSMSFP